jgi:hypothetical protein
MAKRAKSTPPKKSRPARSAKAGRPPEERKLSSQVKRRQKSATAAFSKGTTLHQAPGGSRAAWPASRPMFKKG